jgi:transposase
MPLNNDKKPSYEELLRMYEESQKVIEKKNEEIETLKNDKAHLNALLAEKEAIIKKMNQERFATKADGAAYGNRKERREEARKHIREEKNGTPGRKKGSKNYSDMELSELAKGNEEIIIDNIEELRKQYPDSDIVSFGDDGVSYVIERIKAHIVVHKVITKKYMVKEKDGTTHVVSGPSQSIINHSFAGASLLADLAVMKFELGLPFYRYYNWLEREGLHVDLRTLYNWNEGTANILRPVYEALKKSICLFPTLHIDETYFKIVDYVKEGREHSFMFLISAEHEDKKIKLYMFSKTRETEEVLEPVIADYKGSITVDSYPGYDKYESRYTLQHCLEHLKRKFGDIAKVIENPETREKSVAYQACVLIDKVLKNDKALREKNLSPMEMLKARSEKEYMNDIEACRSYLGSLVGIKDTRLGDAINYYQKRSQSFFKFLEDPYLEPTNNQVEQSAKAFATARKNFLFAKSDVGGETAGILTSIVKTAVANGLYPDEYIIKILKNQNDVLANPEKFLPWNPWMREGIEIKR